MSAFDEWAKSNKYISYLVITAGLIGVIVAIANFPSFLVNLASTEEIKYNIEVEILPIHLMHGALDNPTLIESDTDHPKSLEEASNWAADVISKYAVRREFQTEKKETYYLELDDEYLIVKYDAPEWKAYMYAILPWEIGGFTMQSVFKGVENGSPPVLGQLSRELHTFDSRGNDKLNLKRYFEPDEDNGYVNAYSFVISECSCIFLTFHGSNGQFKGDIVTIYRGGPGNQNYQFGDNRTVRQIDVLSRKARVLTVNDSNNNLPPGFLIKTRNALVKTSNLELPLSAAEKKDDIKDLVERIHNMPFGETRERFIDDNAIDLIPV